MTSLLAVGLSVASGLCVLVAYLAVAWESIQARLRAKRRRGFVR